MQDTLYRELQAFSVGDPAAPLSFTARLARDQAWSRVFADRVVDEYRRFLWLAVRAGHPVTPSLAVDEAWHLHLCYTRSYWDELCGQVLGRPLHHDPTRGGAREGHKFRDWYTATLASYRRHFGEPPADIWPSVAERFRRRALRQVDAGAHWVVPKAPLASVAASTIALLTAGCAGGDTALAVGLSAVAVVALGWVCFYAVRAEQPESAQSRLGGQKMDKGDGGDGGGCGSGCGTRGDGDASGGDGGADGGGSGCGGGGGCGGGCGG